MVEFLADVIYKYSKCEETQAGEAERLAEKIAEFNGGYTLVAKYAGLWLRVTRVRCRRRGESCGGG
jgi:hypothetical protein